MPLPTPNNGEKRSNFMERCMIDLSKKGEFKDNKQRAAVCSSQFSKAESKASVNTGEAGETRCYFSAAEDKNKPLNKPFRTPKGPKKFSVYVKNEKGNIVKVNFGDPNMEIKRDDPARRKSFRARHNCDNAGPKWKARYWSCKQWRAGKKVEGSEWDGETFVEQQELLRIYPVLASAEEVNECEDCESQAAEPKPSNNETHDEYMSRCQKRATQKVSA